jgi:hypothetical protein
VVLSVIVRSGPDGTATNGTLVARPARMTFVEPQRGHQLDYTVRLDPGDACLVGKGRRPAATMVDTGICAPESSAGVDQ